MQERRKEAGASALPQRVDGDEEPDQRDLQFRGKKAHLQRTSKVQMMETVVRHHPSLSSPPEA